MPSRFHPRSRVPALPRAARGTTLTPERAIGLFGGLAVAGLIGAIGYVLQERATPEPDYRTLEADGAFSLRRYGEVTLASTVASGAIADALSTGFRRLAGYIAAKPGSRRGGSDDKIAMTVPVIAAPADHPGSYTVSFVMPEGRDGANLPDPAGAVAITRQPERLVAAVRFAGRVGDGERVAAERAALLDWVEARGLVAEGDPIFAGYSSPMIPGPLRRNEWWVPVRERSAG